jgi:hypothetical protein
MELAMKGSPFGIPVFVVWKRTSNPKERWKSRPVLDMRLLNDWVIKDCYPLTTQGDILNRIQGARHITVVDGMSYFYQFKIRKEDRHRFTVNTHRGAEILNVCLMGFKTSVAHVQRCGDIMLRDM